MKANKNGKKTVQNKNLTKIPQEKRCDKCEKESVITLSYGPHKFCENHFIQFFENRVRKTIRKYNLVSPEEKILIALSGGKDSTVLLNIMAKYYLKGREIEAIIIDEGVNGYREKAVKLAIENCKNLGIKYYLIEFKKEFGITNDELMPVLEKNPKLGGTCAFCGTLRRNIMNKYAKKLSAQNLATGHNLDDEVQSFVMNVFNNDFDRMKRMGAEAGIIKHAGFVKRIKPLYETPEKEIIAYCAYKNIKHYSEECCPYSWSAKRNEYREMLNQFEDRFPGTQYSILRFYENTKKAIKPTKENQNFENNIKTEKVLKECKRCSEPTERELCKACEMIEKIKEEQKLLKQGKIKSNKSKNNKTDEKKNEKNIYSNKKNKKLTCAVTKRLI